MADNDRSSGFNPVGTGEGMLVGNLVGRAGTPFLPSFYNSGYSNPQQSFANSEAMQIAHGNGRAVRNYATRQAGGLLGGAIGSAGGPLGMIAGRALGSWLGPHIGNLMAGTGWSGNGHTPVGTVVAGGNTYDANGNLISTGNTSGQASSPLSAFGPYAGNYMSPWADSPDQQAVVPSFSNYSDQFTGGDVNADPGIGGGFGYTGGGFSGPSAYGGLGNMGSLGSQGQLSGSNIGANTVFGGVFQVASPSAGGGHLTDPGKISVSRD